MSNSTSTPVAAGTRAPSLISLVLVIVLFLGLGAGLAAATAPLGKLLGGNARAWVGTCHGISAAGLMLAAAIGVYLGARLAAGKATIFRDIQVAGVAIASLSLITVFFGNWLYIPYRSASGPRSYFVANMPEIHNIFFEFKEFIGLFTLPLAVSAAFILLRYGEQLNRRPWLRASVAIMLAMVFLFFLLAFGLGASITKLKPV